MQDGIIKGTGNSRYLKSISNFLTQYPTYQDFVAALVAGTLPIDLNGVNETGWDQLGTALNKANLLSDETAEALGIGWTKYTVDLSAVSAGDQILLPEGDTYASFRVLALNYESGLNGTGRVLLSKEMQGDTKQWNSENVNSYENSAIDNYLNTEYKQQLPADVQSAMDTTTFYFTPGNGNNSVSTLSRAVFLLSATEFCLTSVPNVNTEGIQIPESQELPYTWQVFTRTPIISGNNQVCARRSQTSYQVYAASSSAVVFPTFTLPNTFTKTFYYSSSGAVSDTPQSPVPDDAFSALVTRTPAGTILWYGGKTAPEGYLLCDGSTVSRLTYADLFAAIGTTFGVGDGATSFNIPNLRAAFIRGTGSANGHSATALGVVQEATSIGNYLNSALAIPFGNIDGDSTTSDRGVSTVGGLSDKIRHRYYVRPYNLALTPIIKY